MRVIKLEGDAYRAGEMLERTINSHKAAVAGVQQEAMARIQAISDRTLEDMRRHWTRICAAHGLDVEKVLGNSEVYLDSKYIKDHGLAFIVLPDNLDAPKPGADESVFRDPTQAFDKKVTVN